ncbi:MAG: Crp/Fnr family transcriptional regulator [Symbiobacteriia bacterium]
MPEEYLTCAAGVPIFRGLPQESLLQLDDAMHHRRFAKGERVLAAGEAVDNLIVVARGRLELAHVAGSGREQVVRSLGPGDFLGEMALFASVHSEGDLTAVEETHACLLPRQAVQELLVHHHELNAELLRALAGRLAQAENLIADLGLRDVGQRLAAELVRLAEAGAGAEAARAADAETESRSAPGLAGLAAIEVAIEMPVTWAHLAAHLGTTPESLSRRLRGLEEEGLIQRGAGRKLVIRNLERLREIAKS